MYGSDSLSPNGKVALSSVWSVKNRAWLIFISGCVCSQPSAVVMLLSPTSTSLCNETYVFHLKLLLRYQCCHMAIGSFSIWWYYQQHRYYHFPQFWKMFCAIELSILRTVSTQMVCFAAWTISKRTFLYAISWSMLHTLCMIILSSLIPSLRLSLSKKSKRKNKYKIFGIICEICSWSIPCQLLEWHGFFVNFFIILSAICTISS